MRYLTILLVLLISCKPIEKTTTVYETKTVRDTVIQTKLKDTTIFRTEQVLRDTFGIISSDTLSASGKYADAFAWVWNSELQLRLREGKVAEVPSQVIEKVKEVKTTETVYKNVYKTKWYDYFCRTWTGISIIALFLALFFVRIRKV